MSNDLLTENQDVVFRKGLRDVMRMKTLSDRRFKTSRENVKKVDPQTNSNESANSQEKESSQQPPPLSKEAIEFMNRFATYTDVGYEQARKLDLDKDGKLRSQYEEVKRLGDSEDYEQATALLDKLEDFTDELMRKQALLVRQQRSLPVDPSTLEKGKTLGKGAYGEVFLLDSEQGPPLVCKTGLGQEGQADLRNEVEVYAELGQSDNIMKCFGLHEVEGEQVMVMEHIAGGDVNQAFSNLNDMRNNGTLSEPEYWSAMQQLFRGIFKGLQHMEQAGFVHNDLKGDNVMFDPLTGEAKLVDVGRATKIGDGAVIGNMKYSAPEKIDTAGMGSLSDLPSGSTQDVFSAGQMLFGEGEREKVRGDDGTVTTGDQPTFAFGEVVFEKREKRPLELILAFGASDFLEKNDKGEYVRRALTPKKPGEEGSQSGNYAEGFESDYVKFVNAVMHPDPTQRLTPGQALAHPFLKDSVLDESSSKGVLSKMMESRNPTPPEDPEVARQKNEQKQLAARQRANVALREVPTWNKEIQAAQKVDEKTLISIEHASKTLIVAKTSKAAFTKKELAAFQKQLHELTQLDERFTDYARMASEVTRDFSEVIPQSVHDAPSEQQYAQDCRDLETLSRMSRSLTSMHGQITNTRASLRGLLEDIESQNNRGKGEKLSPESPKEVREQARDLRDNLDDMMSRLSRERKTKDSKPSDKVVMEGDVATYERNHALVTRLLDNLDGAVKAHRRGEGMLTDTQIKELENTSSNTSNLLNRFTTSWAKESEVIARFEELTGARTRTEKGRGKKESAVAISSEDRALQIALTAVKQRVEGIKKNYEADITAIANARTDAIDAINKRIADATRNLPRQVSGDNQRLVGDQIAALEQLLKSKFVLPKIAKTTRNAIGTLRYQLMNEYESQVDPNASPSDQAKLLLKFGPATPPSSKGQSDSFFFNAPDGTPAFILKPTDGESRFSDVWPEGGGAAREVLMSRVDDLMQEQLGIKVGIAKTTVASLEDPSFASGTKSKSTKRVGALQETFKFKDGDPVDVEKMFAYDKNELPEDIIRKVQSLNTDDVEAVAIFDFLTLNGDRHAENLMVQNPGPEKGQTRLAPIDSGQCLPNREAFRRGSGSMTAGRPFSEDSPGLNTGGENLLMQLPSAQGKLSEKAQESLQKLDPDKFAEAMKAEYQKIAQESPEMAGTVDDSSFELVRRSAAFLKAAASELTMYEISQVYACGFMSIIDAPENKLDVAIAEAIDNMKEYVELGGNDFLLGNMIACDNPPMELHERLAIAKVIKEGDEKVKPLVEQFKVFCKKLSDIDTYIGDSNQDDKNRAAQLYALHDKLVEFDPNGPPDPNALTPDVGKDVSAFLGYKVMGGDPMIATCLEGNPEAYREYARSRTVSDKGASDLNTIKEFFRAGGYKKLRTYLGGVEYDKIKGNGAISHCELLAKLLKGPPPQTSDEDNPETTTDSPPTTSSPNEDNPPPQVDNDEATRLKVLDSNKPNPTLWFDDEQFGERYRIASVKPKSPGNWMPLFQFCSLLSVRWLNKPLASLTFDSLSAQEQLADGEQLIQFKSLDDQVNYAMKALGGKRMPLNAEGLKDLVAGTRIWMGNNIHAMSALIQAEGKVYFYDPDKGNAVEFTKEEFGKQLGNASVFVVATPESEDNGEDNGKDNDEEATGEDDQLADLRRAAGDPKAFLKALNDLSGHEEPVISPLQYLIVQEHYEDAESAVTNEEASETIPVQLEALGAVINDVIDNEDIKRLAGTTLLEPLQRRWAEKK